MSKIPFLLLLATFITFACSSPPASEEASEEIAETVTDGPVAIAAEEGEDATTPAYVTTVIQADLPSPRKQMVTTLDSATITINYGSPAQKGRNIWGALVPYDEIWRTGANEATSFTTDRELDLGDQILPAGTYGLFTIPNADKWTLIFNQTADQWGAYEYDQDKDVLRLTVQPVMVDSTAETMEFIVEDETLKLAWGKLRLPFPIGS
jgi:hypothetical protein